MPEKTMYVKVRMKLLDENGDEFLVNRETIKNTMLLNNLMLKHLVDNTIDYNTYEYHEMLTMEDLLQYASEEYDHISKKITCIIPAHLELEDPVSLEKIDRDNKEEVSNWFTTRFTRPLGIYLYVKVNITEDLTEEELNYLFDYVSGQMSDGWGEGFEQRDWDFEDYVKETENGEYKKVHYNFRISYNRKEPLQFVDKIERMYM